MQISRFFLTVTVLLSASLTAHAATMISELVGGTVQGTYTKDTLGIWGPAGGNLSGLPLTIQMQYVPAYFGPVTNCFHAAYCTYAVSDGMPQTPGAVLISITINGKRRTFTSMNSGEVLFDKSSANYFEIYTDSSPLMVGTPGIRVAVSFTAPVTFGSPLSPQNQPVFGSAIDTIEVLMANNSLPGETLTFEVTSAQQ